MIDLLLTDLADSVIHSRKKTLSREFLQSVPIVRKHGDIYRVQ